MNRNNKGEIYQFLLEKKRASLKEIAESLNMPKPATHTALSALHRNGSIVRHELRPILWGIPE